MIFIILPQALKHVIPGIVDNFISLFKDTSLVSIVGMLDLLERGENQERCLGMGVSVASRSPATRLRPSYSGHSASRCRATRCAWSDDSTPDTRGNNVSLETVARDVDRSHMTVSAAPTSRSRSSACTNGIGDFHVLRDINLTVMKGERIVIAGPSGSGKSTLIRCINRLEEHQKGQIIVNGIELTVRPQAHRRGAARSGHGVPALQSVPASDDPAEPHAGADLGARRSEGRGRGSRDALPRAGQDPRAGQQVPRPAVGRPAAARRHCALALHESRDHAVRRADLGARPGNGQGSARGDGRRSPRAA